MPKSGVYIITNKVSGAVYIGSTRNLASRGAAHRHSLFWGEHANKHLQSAWDKYGKDAFTFGTLEYQDDPEQLRLAEQFWMDIYRIEGKRFYNFGRFVGKRGSAKPYPTYYNTLLGPVWYEDTGPPRPSWHARVYGEARNPQ